MKQKSKLGILLVVSLLFLTACGTSQVTADSHGFWEQLVYFFADTIRFLSFGGSKGIGIILFTLIIRTIPDDFFTQAAGSTAAYQAPAGKVSW